ncbi:fimbria/pilus chaperone family protein [Burkholderia ubonensis]|uniref:Pilus assembly protein n=1 Tax=Burkholderia ubonensis subsp. mesacidophila TaxID=265293 RepID=A0A2A4FME1_9BURK|nr:fimbria/pilus chaperone family protein [Burkholderia ubonensis]PCE33576.1 pilus assembly protein [Burkholderia ubonensis subsp. mesacidophila]
MSHLARLLSALLPLFLTAGTAASAHAAGMVPETSVVLIDEAVGEAAMKIRNTDDKSALLYTIIEHVPDDQEKLFTVTPPVARVDPGQTQLVRFILTNKTPLKTERLARVVFDSIGERKDPDASVVAIRIRQNLPVVIHPKGLPVNREPWKLLKWEAVDGKLRVVNASPYVVRLGATVQLLPAGKQAYLPNTYMLPGQSTYVMMPKDDKRNAAQRKQAGKGGDATAETKAEVEEMLKLSPGATSIRIQPATSYGYMADIYEARIENGVDGQVVGAGAGRSDSPSR